MWLPVHRKGWKLAFLGAFIFKGQVFESFEFVFNLPVNDL